MPGLSLVSAPGIEPVTVDEAKLYARITTDDEDALLFDLVAGARKRAEEFLSKAFITQTWDHYLDDFPRSSCYADCVILLPRFPVGSVTSVKYTDYQGNVTVVGAGVYQLDNSGNLDGTARKARLMTQVGQSWPSATLRSLNGVEVRFVAGYGTAAEDVPEHIRLGIKELVAYWFDNRDATDTVPDAIASTLLGAPGAFAYA